MTASPDADPPSVPAATIELIPSREADVAGTRVRRALPHRLGPARRRTVGAWCFADHMGPVAVAAGRGMDVGPHPHMGLQTVTWLTAGELLHRDSLGSEQLIRPGQLNLMTAGRGVSHAEEATPAYEGRLEGIQLWVAQPEATRWGPAAFEHLASLPTIESGSATVTALVGGIADAEPSPARRDTEHLGLDVVLRPGTVTLAARPDHEYAIIVMEGAARVRVSGADASATPGELAYLGDGHAEITLEAREPARLMLLGGVPFEAPIQMWWNFVGRTREELTAAQTDWVQEADRFGVTGSALPRIPAPELPWS
jgi:quercetin 2,3-dioxygenase